MSNLSGFAEACYDTNSVRELIDAMSAGGASAQDCAEWGITREESLSEIESAFTQKCADDYRLFGEYVDTDATVSEAEFDAMSDDERVALVKSVFDANK